MVLFLFPVGVWLNNSFCGSRQSFEVRGVVLMLAPRDSVHSSFSAVVSDTDESRSRPLWAARVRTIRQQCLNIVVIFLVTSDGIERCILWRVQR